MNFHRFLVFKRYTGNISPERFFYPNECMATRFNSQSYLKKSSLKYKNSSLFLFKNQNKPNNLMDKLNININKNINKNKLDNTCWQYIWKVSQKY